jgi:hypothetical protein
MHHVHPSGRNRARKVAQNLGIIADISVAQLNGTGSG